MKVTIKDVAREAKVATSTVSRVLSNSHKISEETKKKVNDAIEKLNYTPNIIARGLANNKTRILAVMLPEEAEELFENPFFIQAMKGISICAQKENYYIMYAFKEDNINEREWIKRFTESNLVDGLCLFNAKENDENIEYLKENKFPFVVIGRPEEVKGVLWVDNDNFQAVYKLTQMLVDSGHMSIGFLGAKENLNVSKDRLNGFKQGLFSRDIEVNNKLVIQVEEFSEDYGYRAAKRILKENKVTAIVATDDLLALGVQRLLKEKNINDIAVVGFNNIPLAKYQEPSLSSVDVNGEKLGYYATKLLIDNLENRECSDRFYIIETEFIERDSIF